MTEQRRIEQAFPNLKSSDYEIKSPCSEEYNCIAWAAKENDRWWWPDSQNQYYWPENVPRQEKLDAFIQAFEKLGYEPCKSAELEAGFEKVAIYADQNGNPKHMARQLASGRWTSKLGHGEDLDHKLEGLMGSDYGDVCVILRRTKKLANK